MLVIHCLTLHLLACFLNDLVVDQSKNQMSDSTAMTPLSTVMNSLAKKGYENEFKISKDGARLDGEDKVLPCTLFFILSSCDYLPS